MDTAKRTKNPNWTRDETILALALYKRRFPQIPGETDLEIIELSKTLARLAELTGAQGNSEFRNPTGVSMKLGNLRRLDPSVAGAGLGHGAKMEERVWSEFASRPTELAREEHRVLSSLIRRDGR